MAAITKIEVTTGRLQSDIDALNGHLQKMRQTSEKMMVSVDSMSAMWEGEAKNAFTAQFLSDYQTVKSMESSIQELINNLEYAREKYEACEKNIASIINAIRI